MFSATHLIFITPVLRPSPASSEHVTKDIDFLETSWRRLRRGDIFPPANTELNCDKN
jgi:hypothetical protein